MNGNIRTVSPGNGRTVTDERGIQIDVPAGWEFHPAGDAGITRKITAEKIFWRVEVQFRKRKISKGVWAPGEIIERAISAAEAARSTDAYKKKRVSDIRRRESKQNEYVEDFNLAVRRFLSFAACYKDIETKLAYAVTEHATPVGSGTVARTERIPLEERAERAVIAWLRHQTTAYDSMKIPLIKGKRREVRRMLAEHSRKLLVSYRKGDAVKGSVLSDALEKI